jgi:hypothetical protein
MRAKIRLWVRGLAALAAVGAAVAFMSAGPVAASAARAPHSTHVATGVEAPSLASAYDLVWS